MGITESGDDISERVTTVGRTSQQRSWSSPAIALLTLGVVWVAAVIALAVALPSPGAHAHHHTTATSLLGSFGMWAAMVAAMMLPTVVPMVRSVVDVDAAGRSNGVGATTWPSFVAGYLVVWSTWALIAAGAQVVLTRTDLLADGRFTSPWITAAFLAAAGGYQWSKLKHRCLTGCTRPMTFLITHWRPGALGGLRMGVRHGLTCVGCCWALMALAFVGGLHAWWFMVVCTTVMVVEKLPAVGERVARPLGVALVVAAATVAVAAWW
jgi:predicted metal-binding membrane protein